MKRQGTFALLLLALVFSLSCGRNDTVVVKKTTPVTKSASTQASANIADQLNLEAVNELAQDPRAASVEDFERLLNDPETGVNNLDLDGDEQVDYISVRETFEGDFTLLDLYVDDGQAEYDVAQVRVQKRGGEAIVEVHGSSTYYPAATRVVIAPPRPWIGFGFGVYLGNPYRTVYRSPYYYGYYPSIYSPRVVVAPSVYRSRGVVHRTRTSTTRKYTRSSNTRIASSASKSVVKKNPMSKKPEKKSAAVLNQRKTNRQFAKTDRSKGAPTNNAFGKGKTASTNPNTKAQPPPKTGANAKSAAVSNQTKTNRQFTKTDRSKGAPTNNAFGKSNRSNEKKATPPTSRNAKPAAKPKPKPRPKPKAKPKPKPRPKPKAKPKPKPRKKSTSRRSGKRW